AGGPGAGEGDPEGQRAGDLRRLDARRSRARQQVPPRIVRRRAENSADRQRVGGDRAASDRGGHRGRAQARATFERRVGGPSAGSQGKQSMTPDLINRAGAALGIWALCAAAAGCRTVEFRPPLQEPPPAVETAGTTAESREKAALELFALGVNAFEA